MGAQRIIELQPPLGGLNRQYGYESQPPFTTPDALNVRPQGVFEDRARIGSRPGIDRCGYGGLTTPLNMLATVEPFTGDGRDHWSDDFGGTALGSLWSAPAWISQALPALSGGYAEGETAGQRYTAIRAAMPTGFDQDQEYWIELFVAPWLGSHSATYVIWTLMHDTSPAGGGSTGRAVAIFLTLTGSAYTVAAQYIVGNSIQPFAYASGDSGYAMAGTFRVRVKRDSATRATVSAFWNHAAAGSRQYAIDTTFGNRVGFSLQSNTEGVKARVGHFRIQHAYTSASAITPRRAMLMASSNGKLYRERYRGQLVEVPQSAASVKSTLRAQGYVQAVQSNGLLYIADYSDRPDYSGTGARLEIDSLLLKGTEFNSAPFLAAVPHGTGPNRLGTGGPRDHYVRIKSASYPQVNGDYRINQNSLGVLRLIPLVQIPNALTDVEFEFWRGPKVYSMGTEDYYLPDVDVETMELLGFQRSGILGNVPASCRLCAVFNDRLVLAGQPHAPHIWYMSYQGDFERWDIDDADPRGAIFGTTAENSTGVPPQGITALVTHSDDYLVIGCERSLWVLHGDPSEGSLNNLSRDVGIIGSKAWAITPEGWIIFLSHDGLYGLAPGGNQQPQPLTRDRLPREMMNLNLAQFEPLLEYDPAARGIHVFIVGKVYAPGATAPATTPRDHWWFDWDTRGFWRQSVSAAVLPTSICVHDSALDGRRTVLMGGRDGHVRQSIPEVKSDGGAGLGEFVLYGPFRLGDVRSEGLLMDLRTMTAIDGGTVNYRIYTGRTGEEAARRASEDSPPYWDGSVPAGLSYLDHPRARGTAAVIKVYGSETDAHWAIESIVCRLKVAGKMRAA